MNNDFLRNLLHQMTYLFFVFFFSHKAHFLVMRGNGGRYGKELVACVLGSRRFTIYMDIWLQLQLAGL